MADEQRVADRATARADSRYRMFRANALAGWLAAAVAIGGFYGFLAGAVLGVVLAGVFGDVLERWDEARAEQRKHEELP